MKQNFKIPVYSHGVTMNEIPDKISLVINLGKCECHCKGCHSDYLWDTYECDEQTPEELLSLIKSYKSVTNTVLFMGGNRNHMDFEEFAETVLKPLHNLGINIGIYLGAWDAMDLFTACKYCRWVKVGAYREELGGLDNPDTNQLFLEVQNYKFHKGDTGWK